MIQQETCMGIHCIQVGWSPPLLADQSTSTTSVGFSSRESTKSMQLWNKNLLKTFPPIVDISFKSICSWFASIGDDLTPPPQMVGTPQPPARHDDKLTSRTPIHVPPLFFF